MKWCIRALCIGLFLCLLTPFQPSAQIQVEDRQLEGVVGFSNSVLTLPNVENGTINARSIGLADPFNNQGAVIGGALQGNHFVVVQAFDGGSYWLSTTLNIGPQFYRFGYAANSFVAPGFPEFINGVFQPVTISATPLSPDPITGVDLLECAGKIRLHFIESDGAGGFQVTPRLIGGQITANPRLDPTQAVAPFSYHAGSVLSLTGGAQAQRQVASGEATADMFVRSSTQASGPEVPYQIEVQRSFLCTVNPACPEVPPTPVDGFSRFEGVTGSLGSFGPGGIESSAGNNPGVFVACDSEQDFFLVLPDAAPCSCPPPEPKGTLEGCVDLIGEPEIFASSRTLVQNLSTGKLNALIGNSGESPAPFSSLFLAFDPLNSEGLYGLESRSDANNTLQSFFALNDLNGSPLNFVNAPRAVSPPPPEDGFGPGSDFCMVPGIYQGTIVLRDAKVTGAPTGALQDFDLVSTGGRRPRLLAFGPAAGVATRNFRNGNYDVSTGIVALPYENVFGNPDAATLSWLQQRILDNLANGSSDPTRFIDGGNRLEFAQPDGQVTFNPLDFISTSAGGSWIGALEPGTEIAERSARITPVDYDVCYSLLRIQINSQTVQFFQPIISSYTGSFQDDGGTPTLPADDISYGVFPRFSWAGSPRTAADADTIGFVNMSLPQGNYTGISGFIQTVLAPNVFGVTELPSIDVSLACGEVCTATPNAIVCLSPIEQCNDPSVIGLGQVTLAGTLNHNNPIADAFYSIDSGTPVPIDLVIAGVTCGPTPCSDAFTVDVTGFSACRNTIEITFIDDLGNPISAFLNTTDDQVSPLFSVNPVVDPATPPFPCGSELRFTPSSSCDNVSRNAVPLPVIADNCSTVGDPDSPLIITDNAPAFFPFGTTNVQFSAVDACGNGAVCDVPVIIEDTAPPSVTCDPVGGFTFEADNNCTSLQTITASVSDNCDASQALLVTHKITLPDTTVIQGTGTAPAIDFPLGNSTVEFTVTDSSGNISICSTPVIVIDNQAPNLACPFDGLVDIPNPQWLDGITLEVSRGSNPADMPLLLDWTGGGPSYMMGRRRYPLGGGFAPTGAPPQLLELGTTLFSAQAFTSFDDSGALSDAETYFYRVFTLGNGSRVFECETPTGTPVSLIAETADNCAIASVSNTRTGPTLDASDVYALGVTVVDFTSTDPSTNTSTCPATVEVIDTTPPDITCPPPIVLSPSDPAGIPSSDPTIQAWLNSLSASDLCGDVTVDNDAPALLPTACDVANIVTTVTFTATDERGLISTCSSTITLLPVDADGDGFGCDVDCDETRLDINPGAAEVCDALDNNCDGQIDEEPAASASCDDANFCTVNSCDQLTGSCVSADNPASCDDGQTCTIDSCDAILGCASEPTACPGPGTIGYYKRLCTGPIPEDELTQANAECTNDATTFAAVSGVDGVCAILNPVDTNDVCASAEMQFMALMLNFCKSRLDDFEPITSGCGGNQTAGESRDQADALLSNAVRTTADCLLARCLAEEINSGSALGISP